MAGSAGLAHLIGSFPLESAESVFTSVLGALGHCLRRVPDGETGERRSWIYWQRTMLERHPAIEVDSEKERVFALLGRLGAAVPPPGYHLCYGSPADQHLVMPKDTAILAEIAAAIFARVSRPVDFLHLPVPRDRDDPAYVAPLAGLAVPERTRLYLGLLHYGDGAGDRRRMDAARAVVPSFGVATECGWGRGDPARIPGLLESHRRAVAYLTG